MTIFSTLLGLAIVAFSSPPAQQPKLDEMKMTTYQAVFVSRGEKWLDGTPASQQALRKEHHAYIEGLQRRGEIAIGGPFTGDADLRGIYIVQGTRERALALAEADPGVKAGRWKVEVLPWMAPQGWFAKPPDPDTKEILYFGILVNGPNRAQDAASAQALQREHLDYMDGQAKQGKLVMAGPLNAPQKPWRGLVAYRVSSMDEARERATADPMLKAGRLAAELYEWTVPAGILR